MAYGRLLERLTVGHYMLRRWTLADDVRRLERLGFHSISLASTKLEAFGLAPAARLLRASGLKVAHLGSYGRFGTTQRSRLRGLAEVRRRLEFLHRVGGDVLFVISGPLGDARWEDAGRVLRAAYAELVHEAPAAGLRLALEVIPPLLRHLSFVHTLAEARALVRPAGARGGYVLDFFHSGWERRFLSDVRRDAVRRIHAVQICDYKPITVRTGDRALLGRGILPLRGVFRALEAGGYRGWYEMEIISDALDRIGYERALRHTRATFLRLAGR